jgi:hypothetical protein
MIGTLTVTDPRTSATLTLREVELGTDPLLRAKVRQRMARK